MEKIIGKLLSRSFPMTLQELKKIGLGVPAIKQVSKMNKTTAESN